MCQPTYPNNHYFQDVDITDNPLVIIVNENKDMKAHFLVHEKFEETSYEVLSTDEMWKQFLHVRLNTVLPLSVEATIPGVKNIMQNKRKKVLCIILKPAILQLIILRYLNAPHFWFLDNKVLANPVNPITMSNYSLLRHCPCPCLNSTVFLTLDNAF